MKLREIFRFEFAYQSRRVSTWLYFAVLLVLTFLMATRSIRRRTRASGGYFLNAPFVIAQRHGLRQHAVAARGGARWPAMRRRATCRRGCTRSSTPRPSARPPTWAGGSSPPSPQRADPARRAARPPARRARAGRGGQSSRAVPAGGLPRRLPLPRAAERLCRHGAAVLAGGAQPPGHRELPRQPAPLLRAPSSAGSSWPRSWGGGGWRSCSIRSA